MPLLGRCCHCGENPQPRYVNLKCFNKSDGTIVWEFGPCFRPVQQYGADYVHAFQAATTITFDTYVIQCDTAGNTTGWPNRNSVTLSANAASDCIDVVRLNHDDGTEASRTNIPYLFAFTEGTTVFVNLGTTVFQENDGLSGGGIVIRGNIPPQFELTDFASNNTTKTYVFHQHTLCSGFVELRTRVSNQSIVLNYNVSAASAEAAIEAVGDVSSATVTGGPWPLAPLSVSVTWTSSSGDFASSVIDPTTTVGASERPTPAALYVIDATSGEITSTCGYVFGDISGGVKLLAAVGGLVPTGPDAVAAAFKPIAGASDSVCVSQTVGTTNTWFEGWTVGSPWTEVWTVYNNHTVVAGETKAYVVSNRSQNGNVMIVGSRKTLSAANYIGATVSISAGTRTSVDNTNAGLNNVSGYMIDEDGAATVYGHHNFHSRITQPESYGSSFLANVDGREVNINGNLFRIGAARLIGLDADDFFMWHGSTSIAAQISVNYRFPLATPSMIASTNARGYLWTFHLTLGQHFTTGTEFRFKFTGGGANPNMYTSWLDWHDSDATIEAALNAVFPANTGGVCDNAQLYPFTTPAALTNTTGAVDRSIEILFAGAANGTGITEQYILATYVQRGKITMEFQTVTADFTPPGIASFDRSAGTMNWSREFGTLGAIDVAYPTDAWIRDTYVYAFGPLVDEEIP